MAASQTSFGAEELHTRRNHYIRITIIKIAFIVELPDAGHCAELFICIL